MDGQPEAYGQVKRATGQAVTPQRQHKEAGDLTSQTGSQEAQELCQPGTASTGSPDGHVPADTP